MEDSESRSVTATKLPFVIYRSAPRRRVRPDREAEIERANARRRGVAEKFDIVANRLRQLLNGRFTKQALLGFADQIGGLRGVKVDRAARRVKDSLICWFCENFYDVIVGGMIVARIPRPAERPAMVLTFDMDEEEQWTTGDQTQSFL
jgi:hypothetical protein